LVSFEPVTKYEDEAKGKKSNFVTADLCPLNVLTFFPFVKSHTFKPPVWLPAPTKYSDGSNCTHSIGVTWPHKL
jgi:hypothetical protein